ncbi:MAG: putative Glutamyl-tRNA(Gln) amidotransferase subunit [Burkholderiaceae bacterium]|nr:putative Glutamyl-tRNA(Gln) amidotransferase subunit [Burkholderiaceae bacterium]
MPTVQQADILPYNSPDICLLLRSKFLRQNYFLGKFYCCRLCNFSRGKAAPRTMSLSLSDVQHIANLAQLEISDERAEKTLAQLNGIFALVGQMSAVDTTGIEPLSHPIAALMPELSLRLRDDRVLEPDLRDAYQQCAPATQDGLYLVPRVVE